MAGGFNLWLESLHGTDEESPEEGIARIFRVTPERARMLLERLPCTVKRDVTREEAIRVGEALISIGGLVRLDQAAGHGSVTTPKPSKPAAAARIAPWPSVMPATPATPSTPAAAASVPPMAPMRPSAPAQQGTAATVKLGTIDAPSGHDALRPQQLEVERTADPHPVAWHATAAPTFGSLDIEPTAHPRSIAPSTPHLAPMAEQAFEIEHTRYEAQVASPSLTTNAPQSFANAVPAFEALDFEPALDPLADAASQPAMQLHELGVEHPLQQQANRALALPPDDAPPAPSSFRSPNERRPDPKPREPSPARSAASARPGVDPLSAATDILRGAQGASWRSALQGHPIAGFLLVLGTTTSAALLLYFIA